MSSKQHRKPTPDAIATVYGWVNPKTGELLVSKRGLPNPVEGYVLNRPYTPVAEIKQAEPEPSKVETATTPVENTEEPQDNELPIPSTPEELDKLLGADAEQKGPGRPAGVKDTTKRVSRSTKSNSAQKE